MTAPGPNWKYATALALASVLILVVGWLIRPRDEAPAPATLLSETEMVRLSRIAERRTLESMTAYFSSVADDVDTAVVHVRPVDTTALVWDESTLVAAHAGHRRPGGVMVASAAGDHESSATAWGPDVPVALVRRPDTALELTPVRRRSLPVQPGDWLVAVWRTDHGRAFVMGNALQMAFVTCGSVTAEEVLTSMPLVGPMAGGGLFDAAGELVGMILPCNGRLAAIEPPGVDAMLAIARSPGQRLVAQFGMVAGPMDAAETEYFGGPGTLLVREVWSGSPAALAGLRPGDVMLAVEGVAVAAVPDLAPLTEPERPATTIQIRRGQSTLTLDVPAAGEPESAGTPAAPGAGLVWDAPSRGIRVDAVLAGSAAAAAGLQAGDRLLRVNGAAPQSIAQVDRLLSSGNADPVFVEVERESRRLGVLLR